MYRRANQAIYWPGMEAAIRNQRYTCHLCNERAPSQPKEPYCPSPPPVYPFQQICLDYFEAGHHSYLSCVDRFSGWITVTHYPQRATSSKLIATCRDVFTSYGVSEEISTDGGPQFASAEFTSFLKDWGIHHRLSSVHYPQSNGRAESGVKSARRIILNNTNPDGSLDNDRAVKAILQHRNTPIAELGLSPAQLLLHRQLRDSIPSNTKRLQLHKEWILSAEERERAYSKRNKALESTYNVHAHQLVPLSTQTAVMVQEKGNWSKTGRIVEVLKNRQYRVRMDGSGRLSLRNRRFLRPILPRVSSNPPVQHLPIPSASTDGPDDTTNPIPTPMTTDEPAPLARDEATAHNQPEVPAQVNTKRIPRMLKDIADFNNPGLSEGGMPRARLRGGKDC